MSYLTVRRNYTEVRQKQNKRPSNGGGGVRGKITKLSKKSRTRMLKVIGSVMGEYNIFHTFTFPDEFFEGMAVSEIIPATSRVLDRFKKRIERRYPGSWGYWRRELQKRKTGSMQGVSLPHFHALMHHHGVNRDNYREVGATFGRMWVECMDLTRREVSAKAMRVSTNYRFKGSINNSFEMMAGHKHATRYVSKYMAKPEDYPPDMSIGRCWGRIGKPPESPGWDIYVPECIMPTLKRLLKKTVRMGEKPASRRSAKRVKKSLGRKIANTFLFVDAVTVLRLIEFLEEYHVPF